MLFKIWRKLKKLLPHVSIILAGLFIVLFVADLCNSNMNFFGNRLAKNFILLFSLVTLVTEIILVRINRRNSRK